MSLLSELRRRNVFRMAVLYLLAAWLIMQVAEVVITLGALSAWTGQVILLMLAIGLPIALIFSWLYELTPEGISLEKDIEPHESITHITGRRMDFIVISLLCAAVLLFAYDKWWTTAPSEQSIAVLPFANLSDDSEQEYFSDGLAEDILDLLVKVPEIQVTSRSSAFSFKGQNLDIPTIASKLNVAHVLEGSVRKSGNQLRITAQLIDVKADTHLWSNTYDRKLEDIFAIQEEVAAAVVNALKITLLGDNFSINKTIPEAYALYLQGRHFGVQGNEASLKQAEAFLVQGLALDPGFAPAWTELGYIYLVDALGFEVLQPLDVGMGMARESIQKALAINPQYGRAYAILAQIDMFYDWDFETALMHMQQALTLDQGDAAILRIAGRLNTKLGRIDEAIEQYRQSIALDPVSSMGYYRLGRALYYSDRLEEAADSLQHAIALNPGQPANRYYLGRVLLSQGDAPAALEMMKQEVLSFYRLTGVAIVQHALGDTVASNVALQELIDTIETGVYQVAQVYAFRGEIDEAFDTLAQAYENRDPGMTNLLLSPLLDNLHDDPRWIPLLDQMRLPH